MKTNRLYLLVFFSLIQVFVFAEKFKVAVLDAVIHSGVKASVAIPITENIIEAMVQSGKYTVLDRAHVAKVMEEKKFQVSGIVKSADIKLVGNYLGADIIVVIDISLIEDIYFVSAKMIDVESGEIRNQASHKLRGDVSVIFEVAETVGKKLTGGKVAAVDEEDPSLANYVAGDLRQIDYKATADNKIVFSTYDMMVSGMKGKEIHVEFWISQGSDWMPNSKVELAPERVMYDPAYWNGNAHTFTYPVEMINKFGNPSQPYWGTFYIVNTAADSIIFTKDIQFTLSNAQNTSTTTTTGYNPVQKFFSRSSMSYLYPVFFGNVIDVFDYFISDDITPAFFDTHILTVIEPDLYMSTLFSINLVSTVEGEFVALGVNGQVGGGIMLPLIRNIQSFYGARFGIYYLQVGEVFDAFDGTSQTGFSLTLEGGVDMRVQDNFILGMRLQYESAMFGEGDLFPDLAEGTNKSYADLFLLNALGFSIGIGFVY